MDATPSSAALTPPALWPPARPTTGRLVRELAALVLPTRCAGCAAPDDLLCPACRDAVRPGQVPFRPVVTTIAAPPTYTALAYTGVVREVIVAWKDHDRPALATFLAPALAASVLGALGTGRLGGEDTGWMGGEGTGRLGGEGTGRLGGEALLLVPVPSSPSARRRRGRDTVTSLARLAHRILRQAALPGVSSIEVAGVLRMSAAVRDQVGLGAAARQENLRGAVRLRGARSLAGSVCLLVDDVVTTGASLAECARVLQAAGATCVASATVAATPKPSHHSPRAHPEATAIRG